MSRLWNTWPGHTLFALGAVLTLGAGIPSAEAHGHHAGHADLTLGADGALFVTLDLPGGDASGFFGGAVPSDQIQPVPDQVANYVDSRFTVLADQVACRHTAGWTWQKAGPQQGGGWFLEAQLTCPAAASKVQVLNRLLFELASGYRHVVVLRAPKTTLSGRTDPHQPSAFFELPIVPQAPTASDPSAAYLVVTVVLGAVALAMAVLLFLLWRKKGR